MNRPKYKQMYKDAIDECARYKMQLQDCEVFIKECKKFIREKALQEDFDKIMNDKYGLSLASTICRI